MHIDAGPLATALEATVAVTEALIARIGTVTTPSGRTTPPRSPTGWVAGLPHHHAGPSRRVPGAGRRGARRRAAARAAGGHGRVQPVPRGARHVLPHARGRDVPDGPRQHPPRCGGACPGGLRPVADAARGLVQVRLDDRDPQPPRAVLGRPGRRARRGPGGRSRGRDHRPGVRAGPARSANVASGPSSRTPPTSGVASRRCRPSAWSPRPCSVSTSTRTSTPRRGWPTPAGPPTARTTLPPGSAP